MLTPPLVSVIIPTYDRPGMLQQALHSALQQTYRNIEVIVSDDGTNPETRRVAESMQDTRIRYRRNPENLGEIRNNQAAYRDARGTYIANLHDDDLWTPTFLEKLVPPLEQHPEASIAFCDHYIANPDGSIDFDRSHANTRRYRRHTLSPGLHRPFWRMALLEEQVPVAMASLIRASVLNPDDLRIEARSSYDKWIAYLLCRDGHAAYYHPERLTAYRIHDGQESATPSAFWAEGELFCVESWAADPRLSAIAPELRRLAHQKRVDLGKELLREGRTREARTHLKRALPQAPTRALPLLMVGLLPSVVARQVMRAYTAVHVLRRRFTSPSLSSTPSPSRETMSPIAFIQPFGIQSAGGGSRILRALLEDAPHPYLSISTRIRPLEKRNENEVELRLRPYLGRIERTRFSPPLVKVEHLLYPRFQRRLTAFCKQHSVTALHAIPHGVEFWFAYQTARELGIPYILNVHDHLTYNMPGYPDMDWLLDCLGRAWRGADQRFVISKPMGEAYCETYGVAPYEIVTDGLTNIAPAPAPRSRTGLDMYFMGALHLSYQKNFDALLTGLDRIADAGRAVTLTSRGSIVDARASFPVTNLPWASEAKVERDLDAVNWLYFPLPFDPAHDDFVRYSLSTKLVTYLGSGLPILYHGPRHSAAARLLAEHDAAVLVCSPSAEAVAEALTPSFDLDTVVENALSLARDRFRLADQKHRFWTAIDSTLSASSRQRSLHRRPLSAIPAL